MGVVGRIGVASIPDLLERFDNFRSRLGYTNRSEALRGLRRDRLAAERTRSHCNGSRHDHPHLRPIMRAASQRSRRNFSMLTAGTGRLTFINMVPCIRFRKRF
jgi:hypothetical protein